MKQTKNPEYACWFIAKNEAENKAWMWRGRLVRLPNGQQGTFWYVDKEMQWDLSEARNILNSMVKAGGIDFAVDGNCIALWKSEYAKPIDPRPLILLHYKRIADGKSWRIHKHED